MRTAKGVNIDESPLFAIARQSLKEETSRLKLTRSVEDFEAKAKQIDKMIKNETSYENLLLKFQNDKAAISTLDYIHSILKVKSRPIQKSKAKRYSINGRLQARNWSKNEDNRLIAAIHKYGLTNVNWQKVANFVGNNRTPSQSSQRWYRSLDPKIDRSPWTEQENKLLFQLVEIHGDKAWKIVAEKMGTRSDVQCRYHYNHIKDNGSGFTSSDEPSDDKANESGVTTPTNNDLNVQENKKIPIGLPVKIEESNLFDLFDIFGSTLDLLQWDD